MKVANVEMRTVDGIVFDSAAEARYYREFKAAKDAGLGGNRTWEITNRRKHMRIWKKFLPEEDISELIEKAKEKGLEVAIETQKGIFGSPKSKSVGLSGAPSVIRKLFEKYS